MDETFNITETKSIAPVRGEDLVQIYRSRWELENRVEKLEAEVREQVAIARDLRERLSTLDYQQREFLKGLAKVVDDCDDVLQVENDRLGGEEADGPIARQGRRWARRVDRLRANLTSRLNAYGLSMRSPEGIPSPELDRIHTSVPSDTALPGEIVTVLRPGLLWNGALLRYSLVVVAAPGDDPGEDLPGSEAQKSNDAKDEV